MKHLTTTLAVSLCLSTVVIAAIYAIKAFAFKPASVIYADITILELTG
ncbi:hypothetical protein OAH23_04980 [Verrucomicrobia bacterium]|nr:hypothetical protein [Verrucomicrobiota bacterium]